MSENKALTQETKGYERLAHLREAEYWLAPPERGSRV